MSAPPSPTLWRSLRALGLEPGPPDVERERDDPGKHRRRWLLTLRDGELAHRVLLGGPPTLLGSSPACHVQIEHPRVEGVHLQIVPHEDGAVFRSAGGQGFDCHGAHQPGEVDVGFGTPVFLDDYLMLTVEPLDHDDDGDGDDDRA